MWSCDLFINRADSSDYNQVAFTTNSDHEFNGQNFLVQPNRERVWLPGWSRNPFPLFTDDLIHLASSETNVPAEGKACGLWFWSP